MGNHCGNHYENNYSAIDLGIVVLCLGVPGGHIFHRKRLVMSAKETSSGGISNHKPLIVVTIVVNSG